MGRASDRFRVQIERSEGLVRRAGRTIARKLRDRKPTHKASVDLSEVLTIGEAAAYLNCHISTLYRLVKAGEVPAFRLGGSWRLLRSEINQVDQPKACTAA